MRTLSLGMLSPKKIGALYVLILMIGLFGYLNPDAFLRQATFYIILNGAAISGLIALGVIVPLAAGVFDVSVGYLVALGGTLSAVLVAKTEMSGGLAVLLTLAVGAGVVLVNIFVVVVLRVPSLIGTLATGLVFLAIVTGISNQQQITQNVSKITNVAGLTFGRISLAVIVLLVVALFLAYVLRSTPLGRQWYAVGFDLDTARLAGINVSKVQTLALFVSGLAAVLAGILITGRIGAGSPTTGPDYLLPAFTAAFVGATQFTPGRFNVPGTILAVFLLGTATVGLSIVGAPIWVTQLIQGILLITAVAVDAFTSNTMGVPLKQRLPLLRLRRT